MYGAYFAFTYWSFPYVVAALFGVVCGIARRAGHRAVRHPAPVPRTQGHAARRHRRHRAARHRRRVLAHRRQRAALLRPAHAVGRATAHRRRAGVRPAPAHPAPAARRRRPAHLVLPVAARPRGARRQPGADASELVGVTCAASRRSPGASPACSAASPASCSQGGDAFSPGAITAAALIPGFTAAVIGGITSLPGAVLGGMIIGMLEAFGRLSTFESCRARPASACSSCCCSCCWSGPRACSAGGRRCDRRRPHHPARRRRREPTAEERSGPSRSGRAARASSGRSSPGSCSATRATSCRPSRSRASRPTRMSEAVIFAIIGLSLNVLIGYVGQISLGHQAFVGHRRVHVRLRRDRADQEFLIAVLVAALVGAAQAALLGARVAAGHRPLLRAHHPRYGIMAQESIFPIECLHRRHRRQDRAPAHRASRATTRYYYLCLLVPGSWCCSLDWRLMRTKGGRALLALRENPRVAPDLGHRRQGLHGARLRGRPASSPASAARCSPTATRKWSPTRSTSTSPSSSSS